MGNCLFFQDNQFFDNHQGPPAAILSITGGFVVEVINYGLLINSNYYITSFNYSVGFFSLSNG